MTEKAAIEIATAHLIEESIKFEKCIGAKPLLKNGRTYWAVIFNAETPTDLDPKFTPPIFVIVDQETQKAAVLASL